MNVRHLLLAAAIGLGGTADAGVQCVTADDLLDGIRIRYADGGEEVMTRARDRSHVVNDYVTDRKQGRELLLYGIYFLQTLALDSYEDASWIMLRPMDGLRDAIGPPDPGDRWSAQIGQTIVFTTGQVALPEIVNVSTAWGEAAVMEIGGCTFDAVPGRVTTTSDRVTERLKMSYLPALGVSVLSSIDLLDTDVRRKIPVATEAVR